MNLRTEESNWGTTFPSPPQYPMLEEDIVCDVLVIGGGEAGAMAAYELVGRGLNVVLIDKRKIARGSSFANTGLVQYSNDMMLSTSIQRYGEKDGVRFYKLCEESVDQLEEISGQLDINPHFIRRDSLYFASDEEDVPVLRHEYTALNKHGFQAHYMEKDQIAAKFSFCKPGGIYSERDAEVDPYRLAHGLVHAAAKKGARIYENTEIVHQYTENNDNIALTSTGRRIKARYCVYGTGYETQEIRKNPTAVLASTFALATEPLESFPGWHKRCLIWETARPYLYMRTTADNRIVAGGLDESTNNAEERNRMLPGKTSELLMEVQRLFPDLPPLRAEYSWAATFGDTRDGLPLIGPQEGFLNTYFSMGYGGNGLIYSVIGARIIADLIENKKNPDADLFRIDRTDRLKSGVEIQLV